MQALEVTLRAVEKSDYPALCSFLSEFPGDDRSASGWAERLRFWWDENPAFGENLARGWILLDGQKIAGFIANLYVSFILNGESRVICTPSTWRVIKEYRANSLRLLRRHVESVAASVSVGTTPAPHVEKVLIRLGYQRLVREQSRVGVYVADFEEVIEAALGKKAWSRAAAKCVSPLLRFGQKMFRGRPDTGEKEDWVREIHPAGADFDELWAEASWKSPNMAVKTREIINWYCFGNPERPKTLLGYYRNGKLSAYMILMTHRTGRVASLEGIDYGGAQDRRAMRCFLAYLDGLAKREGCALVYLAPFSAKMSEAILSLLPFRVRAKPRTEYVLYGNHGPFTANNSYLTYWLGDVGL